MLQYVHDYRLPKEALKQLIIAKRLLASKNVKEALGRICVVRCALEKYLAQDNVCPNEKSENGWVKMDDALQLTFSRYQLELVCEFFSEYLKMFPDNVLASDCLSVVNRCRELLEKPAFADVEECITSK